MCMCVCVCVCVYVCGVCMFVLVFANLCMLINVISIIMHVNVIIYLFPRGFSGWSVVEILVCYNM